MSIASIVTLVGVGLIVAVLAFYLITVALILWRVHFNLGTIIIGVKAICRQVEVVPKYVGIILNDVLAIDQAAKQLLAWGGEPEEMISDPAIARLPLEYAPAGLSEREEEEGAEAEPDEEGAPEAREREPALR